MFTRLLISNATNEVLHFLYFRDFIVPPVGSGLLRVFWRDLEESGAGRWEVKSQVFGALQAMGESLLLSSNHNSFAYNYNLFNSTDNYEFLLHTTVRASVYSSTSW